MLNFEGSYAKTTRLNAEAEPNIYNATRCNALLENIVIKDSNVVDYDAASKTKNARVSYLIYHIDNIVKPKSIQNTRGIIDNIVDGEIENTYPPYFDFDIPLSLPGVDHLYLTQKPAFLNKL